MSVPFFLFFLFTVDTLPDGVHSAMVTKAICGWIGKESRETTGGLALPDLE
jgi:hypothetical protein